MIAYNSDMLMCVSLWEHTEDERMYGEGVVSVKARESGTSLVQIKN